MAGRGRGVSSAYPGLDPAAARIAAAIAKGGAPGLESGTVDEARRSFRSSRAALAPQLQDVAGLRDISIATPAGAIKLRVYRSIRNADAEALPVLLFFHSGGWTSGDLDTHDNACRAIANVAQCAVIAVDYRLAPENPFPAAVEDASTAFAYLVQNAVDLAIDPQRIAVGGDSAGANIAAVLALALRDAAGPQPVAQVLLYPATDFAADTPSLREFAKGPTLTKASLDWFARHYLPNDAAKLDWRASPLRAPDVSGLPPTLLATCGFDPLRDEGNAYGQRLGEAGNDITFRPFPGQIHGFLTMGGVIPETTILIGEVGSYLFRAFSRD